MEEKAWRARNYANEDRVRIRTGRMTRGPVRGRKVQVPAAAAADNELLRKGGGG